VALGCGRESVTTRKPKGIHEMPTGNAATTTNVPQMPAEKHRQLCQTWTDAGGTQFGII